MSHFPNQWNLKATLANLKFKAKDESIHLQQIQDLKKCSQKLLQAGLKHFPIAQQVLAYLNNIIQEPEDKNVDSLVDVWRASALLRLTPLQRKQLRMFKKKIRKATNGQRLFCTEEGRLDLGFKPVGQEAGCIDEVQILHEAKVPFILRQEKGNRYKIIKKTYIHGIMYSEEIGNAEEIRLV